MQQIKDKINHIDILIEIIKEEFDNYLKDIIDHENYLKQKSANDKKCYIRYPTKRTSGNNLKKIMSIIRKETIKLDKMI